MRSWLPRSLRREVCPYCFEKFWMKNTPFRCTSPPDRCEPEVDEALRQQWRDDRRVGKVLEPGKYFVRGLRCESCGHESFKRLCPHCHMDLPRTTGDYRNYIFALIGAKDAGKSHYLSVLIDQIRNQSGPRQGMVLEALNDETINRYREAFYNPVYRHRKVILNTRSATVDSTVQKPLIYSLTFRGKGLGGGWRIKSVVTLVFFDTAGEDLNHSDVMSVVNKYIYRSDGIILLIDPLQLDRVRTQLASTPMPDLSGETADIMDRTIQLIQNGRRLGSKRRISIPIAVTFSKFDAVRPIVDRQLQLLSEPRHQGGFDGGDFDAVNAEMEALLERWNCLHLVELVKLRFKRYGFFGVSALGCNPHGSEEIPRVMPRRVDDPFLWLLSLHRLIPRLRKA